MTMGLLLHKAGSTSALHSHLSPVVLPFSAAQTMGRVPPLGYQINHSFWLLQQGEEDLCTQRCQGIINHTGDTFSLAVLRKKKKKKGDFSRDY